MINNNLTNIIRKTLKEETTILNEGKYCYCYWKGSMGSKEKAQKGCEGTDRCSCTFGLCIPDPIVGDNVSGDGPKADIKRKLNESQLLSEKEPIYGPNIGICLCPPPWTPCGCLGQAMSGTWNSETCRCESDMERFERDW